jgi:hypothetical protein
MPCCGNQRANAGTAAAPRVERRSRPVPAAPAARPPVTFEYTGKTALAIIGPITRVTYRFPAPGVRVPVDARDAGAVSAVPNVRRTSS